MDMFSTWLAFLTKELIERCSLRLKQECAGCQNNLLSPILHFHNHFNLLELLKKYQSVCCLEMNIQKLYNNFIVRFGLFDIPQDEFIRLGQSFMRFSTPDAIYYGNYISKENDQILYGEVTVEAPVYVPTPIKGRGRKKKVIS